jgi:hypothetical protein
LVPAGTPPGEYQVTLQVYGSRDMEVLPASFAGGSGGELALGTVRVMRPAVAPPPEALEFGRVLEADFGPLHLWGVTLQTGRPLLPGQALEVDLFWQARVAPGEDLLPRLQLAEGERVLAEWLEKPVAGTYPTAWWQTGELVRDPHALHIPAAVAPGRYHVILELVGAADGHPLTADGGTATLDLGEVEVQGRAHEYTPPAPQHKQVAALGPSVELMGYDLGSEAPAPGSSLQVTLYWHVLKPPADGYHAFVHLLDASDNIVAQHDGVPGEGQLPTLGWLPGEYLADRHLIQLPAHLPPGEYRLVAGLYQPVSWQRPAEPILLETPVVIGSGG